MTGDTDRCAGAMTEGPVFQHGLLNLPERNLDLPSDLRGGLVEASPGAGPSFPRPDLPWAGGMDNRLVP